MNFNQGVVQELFRNLLSNFIDFSLIFSGNWPILLSKFEVPTQIHYFNLCPLLVHFWVKYWPISLNFIQFWLIFDQSMPNPLFLFLSHFSGIFSGFGRYFGAIKVFGHEFDVSAILSQFSGKYCLGYKLAINLMFGHENGFKFNLEDRWLVKFLMGYDFRKILFWLQIGYKLGFNFKIVI